MTQEEFMTHLKEVYDENLATARAKNSDYASENNAFANFLAATTYGVSVEQGLIVRMSDKMTRIANLLGRKAEVADEGILDTIRDLANYAAILHVYIKYERTSL